MSDEAALLAAIRQQPDDDSHRLVYADWLDEYGDSDRAEFIRAQVEAERHLDGSPEHSRLTILAGGFHSTTEAGLRLLANEPALLFLIRKRNNQSGEDRRTPNGLCERRSPGAEIGSGNKPFPAPERLCHLRRPGDTRGRAAKMVDSRCRLHTLRDGPRS